MAETIVKVVKVFIGSPGGLEDERQTAKRIVDEINQIHSEYWRCQIKLVGWEATLPGYSRAQSLINRDLDKCDYFVGVLWDNWGSKPEDGDNRYTSGFEEEFERARAHVKQGLMKDIALFFKDINEVQLKNLHPTYKKVIKFREECTRRRMPLFKEFKESSDFEPLFRAKISEIGWQESGRLQTPQIEFAEPEQPSKSNGNERKNKDATATLIAASSAEFVIQLLNRPFDWDATSSFEIARLRLIAASVSRSGNDELYLGPHDANILFNKRNDFEYSEWEVRALVATGIAGFDHQNVPLWRWLAKQLTYSDDDFETLKLLSVVGNSHEMRNAIRILQRLGEPTPAIDEYFTRERVVRRWLSAERGGPEVEAALGFLRTNGDAEDAGILTDLLNKVPAERKNDVATTVVAIAAKESPLNGFKKLIELDPDPLTQSAADRLFAHPESIPTEFLERSLALKADIIRRSAAQVLYFRQAIDIGTADRLMTDSDPDVRLVAVESLARQGKAPDESTIKAALVLPKSRGLLAIGGYADDRFYEKYRKHLLSQLSHDELRQQAESCGVYDHLEISVLNKRFTRRNIRQIRNDLDDAFKAHFESKLRHLASRYGENSKLVSDTRNLENFLRKNLTTNTLDALCALADNEDLALVRKILDGSEIQVDFLESALRYLGRFGDWSDKDRILSLSNRYYPHRTLLSLGASERARSIALALYAIGKTRLLDLLKMDIDINIRRAFIMEVSQKDINSLSDDIVMTELNNEDDQFRKIFALKCAQAMSQTRISKLLDKYVNQEAQRYYNSVHWLDLGASMPRKAVKAITKFEFAKFD